MNRFKDPIRCYTLILFSLCASQTGIAQPYPEVDSVTISDGWFILGTNSLINRDWDPALKAFRNALQYAPGKVQQAAIHQNLGSLHFLLTDYQKATIHFDFALQLISSIPPAWSRKGDICLNLGFTWLERGEPDIAKRWFDMAGSVNLNNHGLWDIRLALGNGNVFFYQGLYRKAMTTYASALDFSNQTTPISEEEVWLLKNLAWSLQAVGEPDSANIILDMALDRINLSGINDYFTIGEIILQKSLLMDTSGDLAGALALLDEALGQIRYKSVHPDDSSSLFTPLTTTDVLIYRILNEKIRMQWSQYKIKQPDSITVDSLYEEALAVLQLGEDLAGDNKLNELISLQPEIQRSLTGIVMELLMLKDVYSFRKPYSFLTITERLVWFEERCQNNNDLAVNLLPDTLLSTFIGLKRQLFQLHKQRVLEEKEVLVPEPGLVSEGMMILDKLYFFDQNRLKRIDDYHADCHYKYNSGVSSDLSSIQGMLHKDEALIKYIIIDTTLYAFLLASDTATIHRQHFGKNFSSEVQVFIKALKVLDPTTVIQYGTSLYKRLLKPFEEQLKGKFFLGIINDRQLHELPFDALIVSDDIPCASSDNYLISHYETRYYVSLSGWRTSRGELADTSSHLVYTYDFGACAPDFSNSGVTSIPHASREVERIANLFKSENKIVRTIAGKGMQLDTLLTLGRQSRIFHLATHGKKDPEHREFSGWFLAGDLTPSPKSNYMGNRIELGALQSFRMESDLLVLSSCGIGINKGKSWYRMTCFPNNFFHAGVHNILFSLWDVSDKHTDEFMNSFYRYFLGGISYSAALRAAKLQMLSNPETSCPTIWAVFVLWSD